MSVYKQLSKVQKELVAPKNQYNSFGKYKYRSCEDIIEAAKPLCCENELVLNLTDTVELIGDRYYIKATATVTDTETGDKVEVSAYAREPLSKKGVDESQITGATSSYARKYALNGLFAIDDSKDADTDEYTKKTDTKKPETTKKQLSESQVKRLYAIASSKNITQEQVKAVIKKEYEIDSAKNLTKAQYDALCERLEKK